MGANADKLHYIKHKTIVLLNAGHGNLDASGRYTTPPTDGKFFDHKDKGLNFHGIAGNSVFYEGVGNRIIAWFMQKHLNQLGVQTVFVHDNINDASRPLRISRVNAMHQVWAGDVLLLDLHSNAGGGKGWEIWTGEGQTQSDVLAECIAQRANEFALKPAGLPMRTDRSDGDSDREKNFDLLAKTLCPAVTIEHDFFDTLEGAKRLDDHSYLNKLTYAQACGVLDFLNKKTL